MDSTLSDRVAIAALVVSLVALLFVVLQLGQAIVATARGLPNCGQRVIGLWADPRHNIRFRWFLRLEVRYESPVIFLARSNNKFGPVGHDDKVKIWYADGSATSYKNTRTREPIIEEDTLLAKNQGYIPEGVHTVDNELATWVTLLGAIQKMERDSKNWEALKWTKNRIPQPTLPDEITLAVGIQSVKRSFDSHPDIKRPYATTTICHLVELAAVLGIYWKEFNRDTNSYHAEGNGYSLLGNRLSNFGLVFIFERTGRPTFKVTRVIPTCEVKELCFGNVPTFYRSRGRLDESVWGVPSTVNEQKTLQTLQLGSRKEIVETLNLIGCNTRTSLFYLHEEKKHIHLFPVVFEIIGMLGRTLHVEDRCFTFLPNPTIFPWNRRSFSLRRLLKAFCNHLSEGITTISVVPEDLKLINAQAQLLDRELNLDQELPVDRDSEYEPSQLNQLHKALNVVDGILDENKIPKKIVLDVLRRHLQVVLAAINTTDRKEEGLGLSSLPNSPSSPRARVGTGLGAEPGPGEENTSSNDTVEISFDDLLGIPRENRETEFMKKYFGEIRLQVISTDSNVNPDPKAAEASRALHQEGQESQIQNHDQTHSQGQNVAPPPPSSQESQGGQQPPPPPPITTNSRTSTTFSIPGRTSTAFSFPGRVGTNHSSMRPETWGQTPTGIVFETQRNSIWCALVFRMLCWLLLHDFDKKDVQLPKSQLLGSRQPVYIM